MDYVNNLSTELDFRSSDSVAITNYGKYILSSNCKYINKHLNTISCKWRCQKKNCLLFWFYFIFRNLSVHGIIANFIVNSSLTSLWNLRVLAFENVARFWALNSGASYIDQCIVEHVDVLHCFVNCIGIIIFNKSESFQNSRLNRLVKEFNDLAILGKVIHQFRILNVSNLTRHQQRIWFFLCITNR